MFTWSTCDGTTVTSTLVKSPTKPQVCSCGHVEHNLSACLLLPLEMAYLQHPRCGCSQSMDTKYQQRRVLFDNVSSAHVSDQRSSQHIPSTGTCTQICPPRRYAPFLSWSQMLGEEPYVAAVAASRRKPSSFEYQDAPERGYATRRNHTVRDEHRRVTMWKPVQAQREIGLQYDAKMGHRLPNHGRRIYRNVNQVL